MPSQFNQNDIHPATTGWVQLAHRGSRQNAAEEDHTKGLLLRVLPIFENNLYATLIRAWKPTGNVSFTKLPNHHFIARFTSQTEVDRILNKGPLIYFTERTFSPCADFSHKKKCPSVSQHNRALDQVLQFTRQKHQREGPNTPSQIHRETNHCRILWCRLR